MKNWEKYREYLGTGDFHVHTDFTEGSSSVSELCEQAVMNNLRLICFTEHVRRTLSYSYDELLAEIERARERFPRLVVLPGCEAKVLDTEGSLDVSQDVLDKAEIVVASFHSFHYARKEDFLSAIHGMIRHPRVDIWGHPATFLRNVDLSGAETREIIEACVRSRVLIEDSLARPYRTHMDFIEKARKMGATVVQNSDAHCREDLKIVTT